MLVFQPPVEYKYIYFVKVEDKPKTSVWHCRNQKSKRIVGVVKWYGPWRQYCFFPEGDVVFNVDCLANINHFIGQLTDEIKKKKQKKGSL